MKNHKIIFFDFSQKKKYFRLSKLVIIFFFLIFGNILKTVSFKPDPIYFALM